MTLAFASLIGEPKILIIFVTTPCHCAAGPFGCIVMYSSEWRNAHCVLVTSAPGPGASVILSGGRVIEIVSAAAGALAQATSKTARSMRRMAALSAHHEVDVLDDVAEVAGRVPERLGALRLADAVAGAHHPPRRPGAGGWPRRRPVAERVPAAAGARPGAAPA